MRFSVILISIFIAISSLAKNEITQKVRQSMSQLSVGIIGPQTSLDPLNGYNYMDYLLIQCVYQSLVRFSAEGEIVGNLAESWTVSKDRKTYTFKINKNIFFSDGKKVNSADVIFSLSRHGWPGSKSIIQGYLSDLILGYKDLKENQTPNGIKQVSEDVFELTLIKPYPPFLYVLSMPGFSIIPKDEEARVRAVGSGPLKAEKLDGKWSFKINSKYVGTAPNMKNIVVTTFANALEAKQALAKYEVDVLLNLPYTRENQSNLPAHFQFKSTESLTYQHFFVNTKKKISLEVRKSLGQFIHQIAHTFTVEKDFFQPISTFIPPGVLPQSYQERNFTKIAEDVLRKTLSELKEEIRVLVPKERTSESFLSELKTQLKKLTTKVVLNEVELMEFRKRLNEGDYEISLFAYIGNYPDPDGFLDSIRENNFPGVNVNSGELFNVIRQIRFNVNSIERASQYEEALREFEKQWTIIPLYQVKLPFVISDKIALPKTKYKYEAELWNFLWEK